MFEILDNNPERHITLMLSSFGYTTSIVKNRFPCGHSRVEANQLSGQRNSTKFLEYPDQEISDFNNRVKNFTFDIYDYRS